MLRKCIKMASRENSNEQISSEQKISEMLQQSKILEAYMNDILTKEATVTRLITEAHLASEAIQQLSSTNEDESLVPIGIGVFLKVTVPQVRNLLVNVGSGVTIEKSKENAKDYVELRIKEFELALKQIQSQKEQIAMRMNQLQNEVNVEMQKSQRTTNP
ncbi:MAG TPA: prefoldin subunit alpha [Nitrososphaeraceae archaeon]|nr:prefoldin subunit alpha [Nitrososphaeraceae archaeon]